MKWSPLKGYVCAVQMWIIADPLALVCRRRALCASYGTQILSI
jgi:hypothetical protein